MKRSALPAILGFFGGVGIAISATLVFNVHAEYRDALLADGEVIATPYGGSHPEIRFSPTAGEPITFTQGGLISGYVVGDQVRVRYFVGNPREHPAKLDSIGAFYGFELVPGALGIIAMLAGLTSFIVARGTVQQQLRWQEDGLLARMRPKWIRIIATYAGAVWIAGASLGTGMRAFGLVAIPCLGWALYLTFVRATQISFERGTLVIDSGRYPKRFEANLAEIDRFEVRVENGAHTVHAVRGGASIKLPIRLESLELVSRPGNRMVAAAPPEHAAFVAARLTKMLEAALTTRPSHSRDTATSAQ
jgi:hypothetical protein